MVKVLWNLLICGRHKGITNLVTKIGRFMFIQKENELQYGDQNVSNTGGHTEEVWSHVKSELSCGLKNYQQRQMANIDNFIFFSVVQDSNLET
jgi:hypothetical protein